MLNNVVLMGRLTRDPELRRTGSGIAVTSFNVAVERDYGNKDTGERETDFINCVAWRQTGEFVGKWFTKGAMVVVAGRLQTRSYNDKDGVKRYVTEVVADNVYFGESKKDREARESNTGNAAGNVYTTLYNAPSYGNYGGFNGYGGYVPPVQPGSDFAMLDDGAVLPF